jgi:hypothetical protein
VLNLTGLVILVGLAGGLVFHKTGIPGGLFMTGLGVLLDPGLHLTDAATLTVVAPYIGIIGTVV